MLQPLMIDAVVSHVARDTTRHEPVTYGVAFYCMRTIVVRAINTKM